MNMRFMQGTVRLTRFCMECDTPIDRQPSLICQFSNCPHYCHTNILSSPNMAYTSPGSTCYPGMAMRRIGFGCAILVPELETVESPNRKRKFPYPDHRKAKLYDDPLLFPSLLHNIIWTGVYVEPHQLGAWQDL
ncbi:uncharacterized protein LOC126607406 isoform X2 [Malus sylvestris]|nr:uncharacterized protein LOC126607406 isoform X2 [Malus sylvestris]